jgi:hypothetical protein
MVVGSEGVVKCGSYVRLHGRGTRTAFVISDGTIEYSGTSYSTNQCLSGGANGLSDTEVTNSLLTPNNKNVIFTNPAGVTLTGDSTIFIKGDYAQAGNLSGKSLTLSGTAQQTIGGGDAAVEDLIVDNEEGAVLSSPLTVSGTLTLTSGNVSLGDNDLTIAAGGSIAVNETNSPYIITDGDGALTQSLEASADKLYPVGISAESYDPAVINAEAEATLSVKVGSELIAAANTGKAFNPRQWDITPVLEEQEESEELEELDGAEGSMTATITLTPSVVTYSTAPIISRYNGAAWEDESLESTPYTGTFTIEESASFATGGSDGGQQTSIVSPAGRQAVTVKGQVLYIDGLQSGDIVNVYSAAGLLSATGKAVSDQLTIPVDGKGIYIVGIQSSDTENVVKVAVK